MSETHKYGEVGWKVVDPDGKFVGNVEHVREDHLIVAQGRFIQHTLFIPFDHLSHAADGQVTVSVPANQADAQGWRFPPNAGFTHGEGDFWDSPVANATKAAGTPGGFASSGMHGEFTDNKIDPEQLEDQSSAEDDEKAG